MVTNRSTNNLVYIIAILSTIVSTTNGASTNFISRTPGATRYSLRKAIVRRAHVDETKWKHLGWITMEATLWFAWWERLWLDLEMVECYNHNLTNCKGCEKKIDQHQHFRRPSHPLPSRILGTYENSLPRDLLLLCSLFLLIKLEIVIYHLLRPLQSSFVVIWIFL